MYLQDLLLPDEKDANKMAYTEEELEWVKENEVYIWQYFIEKQVLYQTDPRMGRTLFGARSFFKILFATRQRITR